MPPLAKIAFVRVERALIVYIPGWNASPKTKTLIDYPARGLGLDIGINYIINDQLSLGFLTQNLAANYKWGTTSNKIKEDIPILINYFLEKASNFSGKNKITIDQQSLASLQAFNWPGNVRQLKNAIERILIMVDDGGTNEITYDMLPKDLLNIESITNNEYDKDYLYSLNLKDARSIFEYDYIMKNLDRFNGNISKTANFIGMERSAFHRKLNTLKQQKS